MDGSNPLSQWVETSAEAFGEVARTMANHEVEILPSCPPPTDSRGGYVPLVGEDYTHTLGVIVRSSDGPKLVELILGFEDSDVDVVSDLLGELANMMVGGVKSRLSSQLPGMRAGLPMVVHGSLQLVGGNESGATHVRVGDAELWIVVLRQGHTPELREKLRLERVLEDREARLRAVLENIADAIVQTDCTGVIESWNRAAETIFGYSSQESLGQNIEVLGPEWFPALILECIGGVQGRSAVDCREFVGIRKNGSLVPIEVSAVSFFLSGRNVMVAVLRDITARKLVEEELRVAQQRMADLARQAGAAEVAINVMHNMGNLLNSVGVSTSLLYEQLRRTREAGLIKAATLLDDHKENLAEFLEQDSRGRKLPAYLASLSRQLESEREGMLSEIDSVKRGIELIDDIVQGQRENITQTTVVQEVNLRALVSELIALEERRFPDPPILCRLIDLPPVILDKRKLSQILSALLRNARESFGVTSVMVELKSAGSGFRIFVTDDGAGISSEQLPKLFSQGFTTKPGHSGTGLHLASIAAKELGATLRASSGASGQGAVFVLELLQPIEEL